MTKLTNFILRGLASMLAFLVPAAAAVNDSSLQSALDDYVSGLRTGRLIDLQRLFLPGGQFCSLSDDADANVTCQTFAEVLDDWIATPDPSASGRIVHLYMTLPSMAAVTYELHFGGMQYIDQLLLYRTADGWQVVAKTTKAS